jgi:ABC transport system ATP-binding/permease protein
LRQRAASRGALSHGAVSRGAVSRGFRLQAEDLPKPAAAPAGQADSPRKPPPTPRRKLSFKEQREYDALPAQIEALEAEQQRLVEESQSAEFYKSGADHIRTVLTRIDAIAAELEAVLARWLDLEERATPGR